MLVRILSVHEICARLVARGVKPASHEYVRGMIGSSVVHGFLTDTGRHYGDERTVEDLTRLDTQRRGMLTERRPSAPAEHA
jgi:hypothetical protein